jgi:hypothetical protein
VAMVFGGTSAEKLLILYVTKEPRVAGVIEIPALLNLNT